MFRQWESYMKKQCIHVKSNTANLPNQLVNYFG